MKRSLRSWLWRVPIDQEVDEELAFHVEMRTQELVERGMNPKSARDVALGRVGDIRRLKRTCVDLGKRRDREMRVTKWLEDTWSDIRFAVRQLRASPGFTFVAAITLALGIGANSAMFALADATLIRPLPYAQPDRLVMVWTQTATTPRAPLSPPELRDLGQQTRTFDGVAAIATTTGGGPLLTAPDGTAETVERQFVTTRFFDVLGATPVAGRTFREGDEGPNPNVVILSEGVWRRRFGGDVAHIGGTVRLNGDPYTLVGVIPDHVQFRRLAGMWTLMPELPVNLPVDPRTIRGFEVVGRLGAGVTLDAAQADLSVIGDRLAQEFPDTNKGRGLTLEPLRNGIMGPDLQFTSLFLLGVVGFVLLMCCANIANLLLARASARAREIAVRSALGAGRGRIVKQILVESLVLAAIGGVIGIALGAAILRAAPALIPPGLLPPAVVLTFDGRVVTFGAIAALAIGVLFGLVPATRATGTSLVGALSSESRSATREGGRFRSLVVAGEVAAAVLLLCGAGLLLRTFLVLATADTGYRVRSDSVLTQDFSVPFGSGLRYPTPASLLQFYETIATEVSALPEVRSVGWASSLPYGTSEFGSWFVEVVGDPAVDLRSAPRADYAAVSPGYFRTLDLPVVAGRGFTERDTTDTTAICIVNEAFARRYLQGRDPIGARLAIRRTLDSKPIVKEVVGVARQVSGQPATPEELLQVYVPLSQQPAGDVFLVTQSSAGRAEALAPLVRKVVARHDANLSVRRDRTLELLSVQSTAGYRFRATMVSTFAGLALVLAMVGVFGVLAYSIQQQTRELAVRIALGASTRHVLALVLGGTGRTVALGALVGLLAAALLARLMTTFLFRVQPLDPTAFVTAALVLVGTAAVATAVPAIRATRVDPVVAFRNE